MKTESNQAKAYEITLKVIGIRRNTASASSLWLAA